MKIGENIYWVGLRNPLRREAGYPIKCEYGTIYNSYVVKDRKVCVIDSVPKKFGEIWLEKIKEVTEKVDFFIITHTSPYKAEALDILLKEFPDITVIGSEKSLEYLKNIINVDFNAQKIKNRDVVSIGKEEIVFISMPYWPWPDSTMVYLSSENALFSAGGFSAHYCEEAVLLSKISYPKKYKEALKNYFFYVLAPNRKYIKAGLKRIYATYIKKIYPAYGPIIDKDVEKIIELYENWIIPEHREVAIVYSSIYGYTESMAKAIAKGIRSVGIDARVINAEEHFLEDILNQLSIAKGILFGTSTIHNSIPQRMMEVLSILPFIPDWREKKIGVFGCDTYSGKGVDTLEKFLKAMDAKHIFGKIKVKFKPTPEDLENCREFGRNFAGII